MLVAGLRRTVVRFYGRRGRLLLAAFRLIVALWLFVVCAFFRRLSRLLVRTRSLALRFRFALDKIDQFLNHIHDNSLFFGRQRISLADLSEMTLGTCQPVADRIPLFL